MSSFLLLTDTYGSKCVVHGDYIITAVKDKYGTLLTLGDGQQLHIQEPPEDLYQELLELIAEFELESEEDQDEDPDEATAEEEPEPETPEQAPDTEAPKLPKVGLRAV